MNTELLLAHARYQLARHGWLAAAGLALLLLSLLLQLSWLDGLQADNAQLRAELSAQRRQQAHKPQAQEDKALRQANFYAGLPDATEAVEAIELLNRAAAHHKIAIATAEYRVTRSGSGPLLRYQISVPLRADYVALHAWLAEVMNALPHAALDEFSLKREDVGQTALDARVRFTVFLRAP